MSKQAAAGVEEASKGTSKDTPKTAQAGLGLRKGESRLRGIRASCCEAMHQWRYWEVTWSVPAWSGYS